MCCACVKTRKRNVGRQHVSAQRHTNTKAHSNMPTRMHTATSQQVRAHSNMPTRNHSDTQTSQHEHSMCACKVREVVSFGGMGRRRRVARTAASQNNPNKRSQSGEWNFLTNAPDTHTERQPKITTPPIGNVKEQIYKIKVLRPISPPKYGTKIICKSQFSPKK